MTRWNRFCVEVRLDPAAAGPSAAMLLEEEASAAGLLSAGLLAGEVQESAERGPACVVSFLAEHPLDVDQVAAILARRITRRLKRDRVPWISLAVRSEATPRVELRRRCRSGA